MAGQLQIVGGATGMAAGKAQFEIPTASGTKAMPEVRSIKLEANVDLKVKLPAEAVAWAVGFQSASTPAEIKVRTNLNEGDTGFPLASLAGAKMDVFTGTTELIFKSPAPPSAFQVIFI